MKKILGIVLDFACVLCAMFFIMPIYAHAYIDPSATTYIIQAVGAVIVAAGALLTVFRHKIKAFFKKDNGQGQKREIHFVDDENKEDK